MKDINLSIKYTKNQKASYNFRLGFGCSKDFNFDTTDQVKVQLSLDTAVYSALI